VYSRVGLIGKLYHAMIQADIQHRKVWLLSSNIKNNGFYRRHGFEVTAEFVLGDSDPAFCGKPVVVQMVRVLLKSHSPYAGST
jgi:hypothetical protein